MDSQPDTTINSSKAPEREIGGRVQTSHEEPNTSKTEQAVDITYSSNRDSSHIDATRLQIPENTISVSGKNGSDEGGREEDNEEDEEEEEGEEEEEEEEEEDSNDDFPEFEGGEARGRIVNPVVGPKPRPIRPR
ncbi:hypothetical protein BYT27DRAFT_7334285 [Phlegmacium glaucopus]|nr:hypothetical protein BYT27DRAFT_7334285 [Phlegmacium glaucopus]